MSVTSTFIPGAGQLSVTGDALDNNAAVSRNAAGTILVNGGAVQPSAARPRLPTRPRSRRSASTAMTSSRWTNPVARCREQISSAAAATMY